MAINNNNSAALPSLALMMLLLLVQLLVAPPHAVNSQTIPQILTNNGDIVLRVSSANDVVVLSQDSASAGPPSTSSASIGLVAMNSRLHFTTSEVSVLRSDVFATLSTTYATRADVSTTLTTNYNTAAQASALLASAISTATQPLATTQQVNAQLLSYPTVTAQSTAISAAVQPLATTASMNNNIQAALINYVTVANHSTAVSSFTNSLTNYPTRTELSTQLSSFNNASVASTLVSAAVAPLITTTDASNAIRTAVSASLVSTTAAIASQAVQASTMTAQVSAAVVASASSIGSTLTSAYALRTGVTAEISSSLVTYTAGPMASAISMAVSPLIGRTEVSTILAGSYPTTTAQSVAIAAAVAPLATTAQVSTLLQSSYPTTAAQSVAIAAAVSGLATTAQVNTLLGAYPTTTAQSTAISAAVQPLATMAVVSNLLQSTLPSYATVASQTSSIAAAVANLATTAQVAASISNAVQSLVTTAALSTTLQSSLAAYATSAIVSAAISSAVVSRPTFADASTLISQRIASSNTVLASLNDTACSVSTPGLLRMGASVPEFCSRSGQWQPVGGTFGSYSSCYEIKVKTGTTSSGFYSVTKSSGTVSVYCDMTTEGGGWTLFAVKKTTGFDFIAASPSASATVGASMTLDSDSAGYIPPAVNWNQVLFRFATSLPSVYVVYNRGQGNSNFDAYLEGKSTADQAQTFNGWFRSSPSGRTPATGTTSVQSAHFYQSCGISQDHSVSDQWIDMWCGPDSSNGYASSDSADARGTKCVGGYCLLNEPIWLMYRETVLIAKSPLPSGLWTSCSQLQRFGGVTDSGSYQLMINNVQQDVFCDMTTDGGGWTLFAVKITYTFDFIGPSVGGTDQTSNDVAGCIPPGSQWGETLFRFLFNTPFVVFSSAYGGSSFQSYLNGATVDQAIDTPGFWRYTTQRDPLTGVSTVTALHMYSTGISEAHSGSDLWIDMWPGPDTAGGSYQGDSGNAYGTKCVAGWCYLSDSILLMFRTAKSTLSAGTPAVSRLFSTCSEIKTNNPSATTGFFPITCGSNICEVYCDMSTEGGGWTLFATKRTYTYDFMTSTFDTSAYASTDSDRAGLVPTTSWTQILFRFKTSQRGYVVYTKGGLASFDAFWQGTNTAEISPTFGGFFKVLDNVRTPATGTTSITNFHFSSSIGVSERHDGTDVWLDIWNGADAARNYISFDSTTAAGTKCIAGLCFLDDPIWFMFR